MSLAPGISLLNFRLAEKIGEGGMGEVWKATDTTLGRDVAIKILPAEFASDAERLARFEREAKVLASLNHPNIAGIYGLHEAGGVRFLAMELVPGDDLAKKGTLPFSEVTDVARQIAEALEAAHDQGVIHRDLKPANVRITPDGKVKVLDFGLAKALETATTSGSGRDAAMSPTITSLGTVAGVILGTAAYMSPEQARGKPVDKRADIWAFGCLVFEMLAGSRPFEGETISDTLAAVLAKEPNWSALPATTPARMRELLQRCLEKDVKRRLRDIHDVRIELDDIARGGQSQATALSAARASRPVWVTAVVALVLVAAGAAAGAFAMKSRAGAAAAPVTFAQKTFRRQAVFNARFAPDGKTIVYTAARESDNPEIFVVRPEYPEASPLGIAKASLLAISSKNELAILTHARWLGHRLFKGTLARVSLGGGAPRELLENVRDADWSSDGAQLAIIREAEGKDRIEYPIGKVLYEMAGYLSDLRFSPAGDRIAFFEHPSRFDDRGGVAIIDLSGHRTLLADGYWGEEGLAWSPAGDALIYSASLEGGPYQIRAMDLNGRVRQPLPAPGVLTIQDVSRSGTWLVTSDDVPLRLMVRAPGSTEERDLSWLDATIAGIISRDGRWVSFCDQSDSAGPNYAVCIRKTDGSPTVHLGEGNSDGLSPDGAWVLSRVPSKPERLMLYPTGPGDARRIDHGELETYTAASWIGDGASIFVCGSTARHAPRCYVRGVNGGELRPVTPEGVDGGLVSPDGRQAIVQGVTGNRLMCSLQGGEARPFPYLGADDGVIRWSPDGKSLWVWKANELPVRIERLDPATGRRELLEDITPLEKAGMLSITSVSLADDPKAYAYVAWEYSSRLFVIEGAK